jgi:hypothetical protein
MPTAERIRLIRALVPLVNPLGEFLCAPADLTRYFWIDSRSGLITLVASLEHKYGGACRDLAEVERRLARRNRKPDAERTRRGRALAELKKSCSWGQLFQDVLTTTPEWLEVPLGAPVPSKLTKEQRRKATEYLRKLVRDYEGRASD